MIVILQILVNKNNSYYVKETCVSKFKRIFSLRWQESHKEYLGSKLAYCHPTRGTVFRDL